MTLKTAIDRWIVALLPEPKVTLTLQMSRKTREDLEELTERTGNETSAMTISKALALYDAVSNHPRNILTLTLHNGEQKEVQIP